MIKLSHSKMILISGLLWFCVGTMLLWKGFAFLNESAMNFYGDSHPLMKLLISILGDVSEAVVAVTALALGVGFFKGRFVLSKSVKRTVAHIKTLSNPDSFPKMFSKSYLILYIIMAGMGFFLNVSGCPIDIRGAIDVTIGSALLHGSILYFREWVAQPTPA